MKKRVLSGIQPSGKLHLGNMIGALNNWVNLQNEFDCFFFIADLHALTTSYADTSGLKDFSFQAAIDMVSVGLDPDKCTMFRQSDLPEHSEMHLLLSMIVPLPWLERVPTYKGQIDELKGKDLGTYGFLGYPVLQAADILIYKADFVPVGSDQLPHIELTREIARRFNNLYGNVFPEPAAKLTQIPLLPGLDGRKMSKSYGNTIAISDNKDTIRKKIESMITDPARVKKIDQGHPDVCNVFSYYKIFAPQNISALETKCKNAQLGCVECKQAFSDILIRFLSPIQEKRADLASNPENIKKILDLGSIKAKESAGLTLEETKKAMRLI